jgi:hypothetical protein
MLLAGLARRAVRLDASRAAIAQRAESAGHSEAASLSIQERTSAGDSVLLRIIANMSHTPHVLSRKSISKKR